MFPYNALADEDDLDGRSPAQDKRETPTASIKRWRRTRNFLRRHAVCLNLLLFCFSLVILAACLLLQFGGLVSRNWCLMKTSSPCKYHAAPRHSSCTHRRPSQAPVLSSTLVPIINKYMDITLLPNENPSIFRQDPSEEVDAAWSHLGDTRLFPLTRQEVLSLGKKPEDIVRFPESFGLGEAYAGRLEVFHQIHCLDTLRREAHFEHYYSKAYPNGWNDTSEMHRIHLSHCVEYLLRSIVCQASTDIYTHVWTDGVRECFSFHFDDSQETNYWHVKPIHFQTFTTIDSAEITIRSRHGTIETPLTLKNLWL